jgi:hypothetical protein
MKLSSSRVRFTALTSAITIVIAGSLGCSQADIQAVSNAITTLENNKALAEQFVKDVKKTVDPQDPQYRAIMGQYEDARDAYNDYISHLDQAAQQGPVRTVPPQSADKVKGAATEFISAAARGLDPTNRNRGLDLDKAITIPPNLEPSVRKLSSQARKIISDEFRDSIRWKAWSQLD